MSTDIYVIHHTPETTTPAERLALARLLSDRYARTWPEEPPLIPELEANILLTPAAEDWRDTWAVWEEAQALAWAQLEGSREHNPHWAELHLLVHPEREAQGQALREAVWAAVLEMAQQRGVRVIGSRTVDRLPQGTGFLRGQGFRQTLRNASARLDLAAVPEELLTCWVSRPAADPYRLHRWTRVPDAYLARVADLQSLINDMPKGDSELGELVYTPQRIRDREAQVAAEGETRFLVVLEDARSGRLVAYSETYWGPERPALVYQGATAVRWEARGQGLGRLVKADMLRWLRDAAPGARHIKTNVADENAAMNSLNWALGFRPYAVIREWERRM